MEIYAQHIKCISRNNFIDISRLIYKYFTSSPDPHNLSQRIKFGTSGHRGTSENCTFNEAHVLAITQAIIQQRQQQKIYGPCYLGKDTHALSEVAFISVLEVLSANRIHVITEGYNVYTPTPIITHAILNYNRNLHDRHLQADGIVITSSHNPPQDGGIKYYSYYGGIADINTTNVIEKYGNLLLLNNLKGIFRLTFNRALNSGYIHIFDLTQKYVTELKDIINMESIIYSKLKLGVDPMGGASIECWGRIAQLYKLDITLINETIDPRFPFIPPGIDGTIRMDCASKLIINNLLKIRDKFNLIFSNDPDADRYGIVTPIGCINTNDYLIIAIHYLFTNRPNWNIKLGIGKTIVSSMMIDQISKILNRHLTEAPVGFKWFVKNLFYSTLGFVGEESSGGVFLDLNAMPWSTDKDGIIMCLLAAEISASTNSTLQTYYSQITQDLNIFSYNSIQVNTCYPIYKKFFDIFKSKQQIMCINELAGDPVTKIIPINNNQTGTHIDGIKFITSNGWIAIRNSGTETICKIYCESFLGDQHRQKIEHSICEHLTID